MKILSDIPASLMRDLPQDVLPEIVRTLCHALPAPLADGAEALERRDRAAAKKPAVVYREALLEQNLIKIMSEALSEAPAAPVRHLRLVSDNKTKSPITKTETMTGFRPSIVRAAGKGDGPAE